MYYAFTIKLTRGNPTKQDYEDYLAQMLRNNPSIELISFNWEYTRGLHVHACLFKRGIIGFSDLINVEGQRGVNMKLEKIRDGTLAQWKRYQEKDHEPGNIEVLARSASEAEPLNHDTEPVDSASTITDEYIEIENPYTDLTKLDIRKL